MTFAEWKLRFRKDCELQNKILAFNAMGDAVLRTLWETGISPTVEALIQSTPEPSSKPN